MTSSVCLKSKDSVKGGEILRFHSEMRERAIRPEKDMNICVKHSIERSKSCSSLSEISRKSSITAFNVRSHSMVDLQKLKYMTPELTIARDFQRETMQSKSILLCNSPRTDDLIVPFNRTSQLQKTIIMKRVSNSLGALTQLCSKKNVCEEKSSQKSIKMTYSSSESNICRKAVSSIFPNHLNQSHLDDLKRYKTELERPEPKYLQRSAPANLHVLESDVDRCQLKNTCSVEGKYDYSPTYGSDDDGYIMSLEPADQAPKPRRQSRSDYLDQNENTFMKRISNSLGALTQLGSKKNVYEEKSSQLSIKMTYASSESNIWRKAVSSIFPNHLSQSRLDSWTQCRFEAESPEPKYLQRPAPANLHVHESDVDRSQLKNSCSVEDEDDYAFTYDSDNDGYIMSPELANKASKLRRQSRSDYLDQNRREHTYQSVHVKPVPPFDKCSLSFECNTNKNMSEKSCTNQSRSEKPYWLIRNSKSFSSQPFNDWNEDGSMEESMVMMLL